MLLLGVVHHRVLDAEPVVFVHLYLESNASQLDSFAGFNGHELSLVIESTYPLQPRKGRI